MAHFLDKNMIPKSKQESFILYKFLFHSYNNNAFSNLVPSLQSEVLRMMQNKNHLYDFTLISYDENASQNFFKVWFYVGLYDR